MFDDLSFFTPKKAWTWIPSRFSEIVEHYNDLNIMINERISQKRMGLGKNAFERELEDWSLMQKTYIVALEEITKKVEKLIKRYGKIIDKLNLLNDPKLDINNLVLEITGDPLFMEKFVLKTQLIQILIEEGKKNEPPN